MKRKGNGFVRQQEKSRLAQKKNFNRWLKKNLQSEEEINGDQLLPFELISKMQR